MPLNDPLLTQTRELLRTSDGIAYGEAHDNDVAPRWIAQNLSALHASGVDTVYLEINQRLQPVLDGYANGSVDEAAMRTAIRFNAAFAVNERAIEDLVIVAKANGVRVVADDAHDPAVYNEQGGFRPGVTVDAHRLEYVNPIWAQRIAQDQSTLAPESKFIVLGGRSHFGHEESEGRPSIVGVDDRLGIRSIDIYTPASADKENALTQEINPAREAIGAHPFARIALPRDLTCEITLSSDGYRADFNAVVAPCTQTQPLAQDSAPVSPPR